MILVSIKNTISGGHCLRGATIKGQPFNQVNMVLFLSQLNLINAANQETKTVLHNYNLTVTATVTR